jgi:hypothetical protein
MYKKYRLKLHEWPEINIQISQDLSTSVGLQMVTSECLYIYHIYASYLEDSV